jgi:hypothetical protein
MPALPEPYNFEPGDFDRLTQYAKDQHLSNRSRYQVAPVIATYPTTQHRHQAVAGALPADRPQYQAGVAVGSATRFFPAGRGGIGMVASPLQNSAQSSATASNEWHTVGVLRLGGSVWVYDPMYQMGSQTRLPMMAGVSNVTRLLNSTGFGSVTHVQVWGDGSDNQDCMGRTAQWIDNVVNASNAPEPFPEGAFVEGRATPGWQVVARF